MSYSLDARRQAEATLKHFASLSGTHAKTTKHKPRETPKRTLKKKISSTSQPSTAHHSTIQTQSTIPKSQSVKKTESVKKPLFRKQRRDPSYIVPLPPSHVAVPSHDDVSKRQLGSTKSTSVKSSFIGKPTSAKSTHPRPMGVTKDVAPLRWTGFNVFLAFGDVFGNNLAGLDEERRWLSTVFMQEPEYTKERLQAEAAKFGFADIRRGFLNVPVANLWMREYILSHAIFLANFQKRWASLTVSHKSKFETYATELNMKLSV